MEIIELREWRVGHTDKIRVREKEWAQKAIAAAAAKKIYKLMAVNAIVCVCVCMCVIIA